MVVSGVVVDPGDGEEGAVMRDQYLWMLWGAAGWATGHWISGHMEGGRLVTHLALMALSAALVWALS